jgi:proteasome lid subunit RPN8/RPN11
MKLVKDIKLLIKKEIYEDIMECVNKAFPNEACGIVFGKKKEISNPSKQGDYFYHYEGEIFRCFESDRKSPVAFLMENVEVLNKIYQEVQKEHQLKMICIFHSHPSGNYPSGIDTKNMKRLDEFKIEYAGRKDKNPFKNAIWVIMDASTKEMKSFLYFKGEVVQTDLIIQKN